MSKILAEIKYSLLMFFRNKGNMFWTFGFPVIMLLLMGMMYGLQSGPLTLSYANDDGSASSMAFVDALNATGAVRLQEGTSADLAQSLKDGKIGAYLEIPHGFGNNNSAGSHVELYYDKSQQTSAIFLTIVQQVTDAYNLKAAGAKESIALDSQDVATTAMKPLDFALPGIIGMCMMLSAITTTVSINVKNRARGIFRKLATTPLSRVEWNISKIISQTIITLLSIALSLAIAYAVYGIHINFDVMAFALILFGTMTFVGLGMIFAGILKSEESASTVSTMICFPLMFISGTFFSVDLMPSFLQDFARISPLTYLNYGLRDAMISGNFNDALFNLGVVAVLGVVFFAIGVVLMKWKEE